WQCYSEGRREVELSCRRQRAIRQSPGDSAHEVTEKADADDISKTSAQTRASVFCVTPRAQHELAQRPPAAMQGKAQELDPLKAERLQGRIDAGALVA